MPGSTPAAGVALAVGLGCVAWLGAVGGPHGPIDAARAVALTLFDSGPAIAYLIAAVGLGRVVRRVLKQSADPLAMQVAIGLSLMLTLSHLLGVCGLLGGGLGRGVAVGVVVVGIALAVQQAWRWWREWHARPRGTRSASRVDWVRWIAVIAAAPALATLIVAACNPPGVLWASEFGGFDALSYHLQLPREWLALGRIRPFDHNVYSYLPGYVEAAFMHLGAMRGVTGVGPADGAWLMSCQVLHAGITALAAWLIARAAGAVLSISGLDRRWGVVAGAVTIATPWCVVVGSLAYNEMGMIALFAGAVLGALDVRLSAWARGAVCGWLVGAACGVKPTAILFVAPAVGIVLLCVGPRRDLFRLISVGAVAGVIALTPWTVRNAAASGNPIFPYGASFFGTGHWDGPQVTRYTEGHAAHEPMIERVRLLVRPDPRAAHPGEHRGILHEQWGGFAFIAIGSAAAMGICAARRARTKGGPAPVAAVPAIASDAVSRTISAGVVGAMGVAVIVAQVAAWVLTTHVQSRFLIPLIVPGAMLTAQATATLAAWSGEQIRIAPGGGGSRTAAIAGVCAALAVAWQTATTAHLFTTERSGHPNAMLVDGAGVLTGEAYRRDFEQLAPTEREGVLRSASMEFYAAFGLPPGSRLYLLGDSTPLYFACGVLYHTTWDRSPLGDAIRAYPGDADAWARELRGRGVTHVLLNASEIARLQRSGWYDPMVTPETARAWLDRVGTRIHGPGDDGRLLYSLLRGNGVDVR